MELESELFHVHMDSSDEQGLEQRWNGNWHESSFRVKVEEDWKTQKRRSARGCRLLTFDVGSASTLSLGYITSW